MSAESGALAVEGVSHVFERVNQPDLTVLDRISLSIEQNSFVSLVGPSGCGKSTLLRMMAGLEHPTTGRILLDGRTVEGPTASTGMVFQQDAVFPWMTVQKNVEYGPRSRGLPRAECARIAEQWIRLVGLDGFASSYSRELSGGMRKRVDLARVYANNPRVLLMDEPFGALDSQTRETMQDELLRIWEAERKTVVFVTHDLEEALYLSDRVIVMSPRPGRIVVSEAVGLGRPRPANIRISDEFVAARRRLWSQLHS
ncbi:MAG TPA: ABC transporter ATP-binding protein [Reyranella sp.]|nr:ABC transporter ATP-binding protein [Reyranella sp.]